MRGSTTDTTDAPDPFAVESVELTGTRRGDRARRRRRRQRARRLRVAGIAAVVVIVLGAVALLVGGGGGGGGDSDGDGDGAAASAIPPFLVAQRDGSGQAVSLTVLVPAAGGKGGSMLLIPPGTMTEVGALGLEPVGRILALQGPDRMKATLENLLGAGLQGVIVVDDAALAALLAPVGPLTVQVPERVEQVDPTGRVNVLYEAGPVAVAPDQVGPFLAAKGQGTDLARLARHQFFLDAWLNAIRQRPGAAPTEPPALAQAFAALAAGNVRTRLLPVEAFGGTGSAQGELYRVREDELTRLVDQVFPSAGDGARPRIQILNGTGAVGLADAVRDKLGPGFDVRLTGNAANFNFATTQVVYYDRAEQALAQRALDALGAGALIFSRRPLDVVDVTIIVGKDFNPA